MEHLTLQVGDVDDVVVHDADGHHPRRRQVEGGRRAEPSGPHYQDLGAQQVELSRLSHLGEPDMAGVTRLLVGGEPGRVPPRKPGCLPCVEAARQGEDVSVTHVEQ
jgi:hypothetical protein